MEIVLAYSIAFIIFSELPDAEIDTSKSIFLARLVNCLTKIS